MDGVAKEESRNGRSGGDQLFLGAALIGVGTFLLIVKDQAGVTGLLTPDLAAGLGIVTIVVGLLLVVFEVVLFLDRGRSSGARRGRRRGRGGLGAAAAERQSRRRGKDHSDPCRLSQTPPPDRSADSEWATPELLALQYVALSVADRDRSARWYAEVLGFEEVFRQDGEGRRACVMRFASGGYSVALVEHRANGAESFDPARTGLDHVAFSVGSRADLERWEQRLDGAGVVHSDVLEVPPGAILSATDPDGIRIALFWAVSRHSTTPSRVGET